MSVEKEIQMVAESTWNLHLGLKADVMQFSIHAQDVDDSIEYIEAYGRR